MESKWIIKSRSAWLNGLLLLIVPGLADFAGMDSTTALLYATPSINLLLRYITNQPVGGWGKKWYFSRTVLFNLFIIFSCVLLMITASGGPQILAEIGLIIFCAVNIYLRINTTTKNANLLPRLR